MAGRSRSHVQPVTDPETLTFVRAGKFRMTGQWKFSTFDTPTSGFNLMVYNGIH
jgi:hypothetical protein